MGEHLHAEVGPSATARATTLMIDRERELLAQVAGLQEAVSARDTFIAIAAHELRNPMTPIVGQLSLLVSAVQAGRLSADQLKQRLDLLQNAVKRYLKRAEVLLDVSRINAGRLSLEPTQCDLALMLHKAVDEFRLVAKRANVPITVHTPDTLPGTWDCLALEQILENLISNAFKHGDRTPIELTAQAFGEQVHITVRDHGEGISEMDRERVFERFEQAVRPGEQRTGFGIGLWLVRELTVAMGGTIGMDDASGGGALFTVILPRHMLPAAP